MVVLIDTNVLIDLVSKREPFFGAAKEAIGMCACGRAEGYVAFHSLPDMWYILRRKGDDERRRQLLDICEVLTVTGATHDEVVKAIKTSGFRDFEDCLQDRCAAGIGAEYIVTRNVKDFSQSEVRAITPEEFCVIMREGETE